MCCVERVSRCSSDRGPSWPSRPWIPRTGAENGDRHGDGAILEIAGRGAPPAIPYDEVRMEGLEPTRLSAQDSKSCVSANFTTSAWQRDQIYEEERRWRMENRGSKIVKNEGRSLASRHLLHDAEPPPVAGKGPRGVRHTLSSILHPLPQIAIFVGSPVPRTGFPSTFSRQRSFR